MEPEFSLTVCICTRHRPDDLRRCLESLREADPAPHQVIVSDDGEDDRTARELVSEFPFAEYQRGPRLGLGANRNACIASATGRFISFIDDDVTVPSSYVANAFRATDLQGGDGQSRTIVTGIEFNHSHGMAERVEPNNADFWGYQKIRPSGIYRSIVINSTVFPATLFGDALFDPQLRYGSDEIDMARHAVSLGYTIAFAPDLSVDHWPSPINRGEYVALVDASRMYATAKSYLLYEKNQPKAIVFVLLAPLKLAFGMVRRHGVQGIARSSTATLTACRYAIRKYKQA